jgi:ribulose-phosphate 3-epimerase
MAKVIPAILTDDPVRFEQMLRMCENLSDEVHIDFMDGKFVETVSVHPQSLVASKPTSNCEVHLMVSRPDLFIVPFKQTRVARIIFHVEAVDNVDFMVRLFKDEGFAVGLALNPETPTEQILPHLPEVDMVHFLSVHPGRQGNPFQPLVLDKIMSLRQAWRSGTISVDGGVKTDNIAAAKETGVDRIVIGSTIWQSADPQKAYHQLKEKVQ